MKRLVFILLALSLPAVSVAVSAATPAALNYQGRLTDSGGSPVADGSKSVHFVIYNDATASAAANILWDSGPTTVTTTDGLFSVMLGAAPMTPLPDSLFADSSAWLGVTVGSDPELVPRTRLVSVPYAYHARSADAIAGDVYVRESGDTVNGSLAVSGNFSAGTDSVEAPITMRTQSNWRWDIGNGLGDVRFSDGVRGLSFGIASGGGGAGHVHVWPSGGSQLLTFGSPTSGDQFTVDGNLNQVFSMSPFSVQTNQSYAPLTVQSFSNWSWDIGSGLGDLYVGNGSYGFSIGVSLAGGGAGITRLWSAGSGNESIILGSPTFGNVFEVHGDGSTIFRSTTDWVDSASLDWRIHVDPKNSELSVYGADFKSKVHLYGSGSSGSVWVMDSSNHAGIFLYGGDAFGGEVNVNRDDGHFGGILQGGSSASGQGGRLDLYDGTSMYGTLNLHLDGRAIGDASAIFPDDAISSPEILDEPGIVAGTRALSLTLSSTVSDIVTVTITIPSSGYIVLRGVAQIITSGTTSFNDVAVQIDETAGGTLSSPYFARFGLGGYVNTSANYIPLSVQRNYFKGAGTYTFRLEGNVTTSGGSASCNFAQLTAMYVPTSYGSVTTVAASPDDLPKAKAVRIEEASRNGDRTITAYEADLSVLEQRAREAKKAAVEAVKAQIQAELELNAALQNKPKEYRQ